MKILLVRHGDYDIDLTDYGREQIKVSAEFLKGFNMDINKVRIFTSPQKRAVSSAEIICQTLGLPKIETTDWLDAHAEGYVIPDEYESFIANIPNCQIIIAVSHKPIIEDALKAFAQIFRKGFNGCVRNGSVHIVDIEAKTIQKLFEP